MDNLRIHSPDLIEANIVRLAELFANCVTEARDANGELKCSIDVDPLRQDLSSATVEGPQGRYQLNWPGKREALLTANAPIAKTLRPCREESVDFDTMRNQFIEGYDLNALKLLQKTYPSKVKLIYIDPPYNTGSDFIYEDDFAEDAESYFLRSEQCAAHKPLRVVFLDGWLRQRQCEDQCGAGVQAALAGHGNQDAVGLLYG